MVEIKTRGVKTNRKNSTTMCSVAPWLQRKQRVGEGKVWCVSKCAVITGFDRGKEREGPGFQG